MDANQPDLGLKPLNGIPYTCMLVDDSRTLRMFLKQILLSQKFQVIMEADNGEAALKMWTESQNKPDLLFIDIEMPVMSGIELVRELKKADIKSKIIMVTATTNQEIIKELISIGITDYIVKPYDREIVLEKIARDLGRNDLIKNIIK